MKSTVRFEWTCNAPTIHTLLMKTTQNKLTAEMVHTAAAAVGAAGCHEDKAYIYDVLVHLIEVVGVWATGEELRAELVSLHRAGQIELTRCDLVAAFDGEKIGPDGTCRYLSAEWQFIAR